MSNSYLITIIIPAYNIQDYIDACVESILPQLSEDIELIIVNDGSTDMTGAICDSLAALRANVSVIHQKNLGVSAARNNGLMRARGRYICYVDGDDILASNAMRRIKEKIVSTEADIVSGQFIKFNRQINPKKGKITLKTVVDTIESKTGEYALAEIIEMSMFLPSMCTTICKKSLLIDNNIRFEAHLVNNEDIDCAMQLYILANKIAVLEEPHYYYRQSRRGSASKSYSKKRVESSLFFIETWYDRLSVMSDLSPVKYLLMDYLLYQYSITLGAIYLCPREDRGELSKRAAMATRLFEFSRKRNTQLVSGLYHAIGLGGTGMVLASFIKLKAFVGKYA